MDINQHSSTMFIVSIASNSVMVADMELVFLPKGH